MSSYWIYFAFAAGIGDTIYNFTSRHLLKDGGDAASTAWWFSVIRSLIFLLAVHFDYYLLPNIRNIIILLTLAVVNFANINVFMRMHTMLQLSLSAILVRLRLVWIPIVAFILIREVLTPIEYVGILMLLAAAIIAVSPKKMVKDHSVNYAIILSITTSVSTVLMKMSSGFASNSVIILTMSLPSAFIIPFLMKKPKQRFLREIKSRSKHLITMAMAATSILYLTILALRFGQASRVNAATQSVALIAVAAGIVFLKERKSYKRKIISAFIAVIGIMLVI